MLVFYANNRADYIHLTWHGSQILSLVKLFFRALSKVFALWCSEFCHAKEQFSATGCTADFNSTWADGRVTALSCQQHLQADAHL